MLMIGNKSNGRNAVSKWIVKFEKVSDMRALIEADSYDDAFDQVNGLCDDIDFDCFNSDWHFVSVELLKGQE